MLLPHEALEREGFIDPLTTVFPLLFILVEELTFLFILVRYNIKRKRRKTVLRKNISLKWLEKNLACGKACQRFEKMFGQITTVKEVVDALHKLKRDDWEGWLLAQEPSLTTTMLKHGADIHADNDHVIRWAVLRGSFKVVELLLKHGADIHVSNDYALRVAAARGNLKVVELLLKHGADIHAREDYALRAAAAYGYLKVVELLLKHGADIHVSNDYALRVAATRGYTRIANLLRKSV